MGSPADSITSSETQKKIVGTRAKSAEREKIRRYHDKVRRKNKSAGGRTLCGPVPIEQANPGFRWGRKPFVFFRANQRTTRLKHPLCVLTRLTRTLVCSSCLSGSIITGFSIQSGARIFSVLWTWSIKSSSLGALIFPAYFGLSHFSPLVPILSSFHHLPLGLRG